MIDARAMLGRRPALVLPVVRGLTLADWEMSMPIRSIPVFSRATAVASVLFVSATAHTASAAQLFTVNFAQINGMGASGTATLELNDDATSLGITVQAMGLEPGGVHLGHIHGLFSDVTTGMPVNSTTPGPAQDADGDGFVELAEGLVTYGPILVDFGNVDPDLDGSVNFSRTFDLTDPSTFANGYTRTDLLGMDLSSLHLREIVLHGMSVPAGAGANTPGEVDGTGGYKAVLPILSGQITAVPEPATWGMMLLGFGAIGSTIRMKKAAGLKPARSNVGLKPAS
jgi:hypothetical protein